MWCDLRCWHPGRVPFEFRESSWLGTELMTSAGSQNAPGQRRTLGEQIRDVASAFSRKCAWCIHPSHHYWVPTTHLTLWWVLGGSGQPPADVDPANKIFSGPPPLVPTPELSSLSCQVGFTSCFPFLTFQSPLHPLQATSGPTSPWKPLLLRTLEFPHYPPKDGAHSPIHVCKCAKSLQSCLTLCNPVDGLSPGFSAMGFSRQEYWSGLHALLQGIFPSQGLNPHLLGLNPILHFRLGLNH